MKWVSFAIPFAISRRFLFAKTYLSQRVLLACTAVGLGRPRRFLEAGGCQVAFVWDRIIIGFNIHDIQELNTLMVRVDGCLWPLLPFV